MLGLSDVASSSLRTHVSPLISTNSDNRSYSHHSGNLREFEALCQKQETKTKDVFVVFFKILYFIIIGKWVSLHLPTLIDWSCLLGDSEAGSKFPGKDIHW